jgi:choloylglycine hydrolase
MRTAIRSASTTLARRAGGAALCAFGLWAANAAACTDVMVPPDPTILRQVVSARTLDFPLVDASAVTEVKLQAFERDRAWQSDWTKRGNGKQWQNEYGFVAMHVMKEVTDRFGVGLLMIDGLNEPGLSAGYLWLWATQYPKMPKRAEVSVSFVDAVAYILGNFRTVAEVKAAMTDKLHPKHFEIWGERKLGDLAPLHLVVRDRQGKSLIVEWIDGNPRIYDGAAVDDVGVLTNDPPYPDQVKELEKHYRDVTPADGLLGIPGDPTYQSRFIRIAKLRQYAHMQRGGVVPLDALQVAAHLINNADVVYGTNREYFGKDRSMDDYSGPTLIRDHRNSVLYFKGHNNQSYRMIDLAKIHFGEPLTASILADPLPTDPIFQLYRIGQDVTYMLNAGP